MSFQTPVVFRHVTNDCETDIIVTTNIEKPQEINSSF